MSSAPHNPAYYNEDDGFYAPLGVIAIDEKPAAKVTPPPIIAEVVIKQAPPANVKAVIPRTFSAVYKIIAIGLALFFIGAVGILIYFNAHPVLYKSTGLEGFELKSVLAEEPEVLEVQAPQKPREVSTARLGNHTSKPLAKNTTINDYILSIQPKQNEVTKAPVAEVIIEKNSAENNKVELKQEATLVISNVSPPATPAPKPAEKTEKVIQKKQ